LLRLLKLQCAYVAPGDVSGSVSLRIVAGSCAALEVQSPNSWGARKGKGD
jgi:hypothetical protein